MDQTVNNNNNTNPAGTAACAIAISSGKGGVGKTSIAVNLGIALARNGASVCLFDADTGLANVNILLGLSPEFTLEHVLFGTKSIEDVMLEGPYGLKIVPGANGIGECVALHPRQQMRLTRELARVEGEFDYLLIDTAAGIADTTLDFVSAAHQTLVVITPEPTSLTDAFSLIKLLKRRRSEIDYQVVVNMCSSAGQAREIYHRFDAAVEKYIGVDTHYLGFVLRDESLRAAVALQSPVTLFPESDPSCRGFLRLADKLDQVADAAITDQGFSGYWQQRFQEYRQQLQSPTENTSRLADINSDTGDLAEQQEVGLYLQELRARLLLLMEKQEVDGEVMAKWLHSMLMAHLQHFPRQSVDIQPFLEGLISSPGRDDQLLRSIYELVRPWGNGSSQQPLNRPVPVVEDDAKNKPSPAAADFANTAETMAMTASTTVAPAHGFDSSRFGSQEQLLDLIKQGDSDCSLMELLDSLG